LRQSSEIVVDVHCLLLSLPTLWEENCKVSQEIGMLSQRTTIGSKRPDPRSGSVFGFEICASLMWVILTRAQEFMISSPLAVKIPSRGLMRRMFAVMRRLCSSGRLSACEQWQGHRGLTRDPRLKFKSSRPIGSEAKQWEMTQRIERPSRRK
jgi:hypothetical protein